MLTLRPRDRKTVMILLTAIAFVVVLLSAVTIHDSSDTRTVVVCGVVAAAGGVATMIGFLSVVGAPLSRSFVWPPFFIWVFTSLLALIAVWSGEIVSFAFFLLWGGVAVLCWIAYSSEPGDGEAKPAQPVRPDNVG
jgi:hypothetical protein